MSLPTVQSEQWDRHMDALKRFDKKVAKKYFTHAYINQGLQDQDKQNQRDFDNGLLSEQELLSKKRLLVMQDIELANHDGNMGTL